MEAQRLPQLSLKRHNLEEHHLEVFSDKVVSQQQEAVFLALHHNQSPQVDYLAHLRILQPVKLVEAYLEEELLCQILLEVDYSVLQPQRLLILVEFSVIQV